MEDAPERPVAYLPDDLVVEILSRLPAKSLCRCRCVSKSWRALISDPAHRQSFAHTTSCLFFWRHCDDISSLGFVTGDGDGGLPLVDSALTFLPAASSCDNIELLDSCNGLLLLRCSPATGATGAVVPPSPAFYVVGNPATREWVALPQPSLEPGFDNFYTKACRAALGFDPSASPHFYVFQLEEKEQSYDHFVRAVEIYSSETGAWVRTESGWRCPHKCLRLTGHMTYFNGFLHLTTWEQVIAMVDARGQAWRTIPTPSNGQPGDGFVSHSQGRLIYVDVRTRRVGALVTYVLEDHGSEWWTLKHKVSNAVLFAPGKLPRSDFGGNPVVAFDPNRDMFFFYDRLGKRLVSYDMDQGRARVVCTLEHVAYDIDFYPFFLYVPLYSAGMLDPQMSSRY